MMLKLLSYPRSILSGILCLVWTFLWSLFTVISAYLFKATSPAYGDFISRHWGRGMLWLFNIHLKVKGLENLNSENGIFVFNHSSHFDIPILFVALKQKSIRFGAKAELFRIPIFGKAMSRIGALKIHRAQRDKVLELYKNSLKNLDIGLNYILAPEGTRQESGELGEFKMGPFIMAISGQCPIYPVVIKGAYKIMPKHSIFPSWGLWSSRVEVHVLPPILTKGKSLEDKIAIKEEVRKKMLDLLKVSSGPLDG